MADSDIPNRFWPAVKWAIAGIFLFVFFLEAADAFREGQLKTGVIFGVLFVLTFGIVIQWEKIVTGRSAAVPKLDYLSYEDSDLGSALCAMAWCSAWGKWFPAQSLAQDDHKAASEWSVFTAAASLVQDALIDGRLAARGRSPGGTDYEDISREAWRLAALKPEPNNRTRWKVRIIPRSDVEPARIGKLLAYDNVTVNARQFEALWPLKDKKTDAARRALLKRARKAGADPAEIAKLDRD